MSIINMQRALVLALAMLSSSQTALAKPVLVAAPNSCANQPNRIPGSNPDSPHFAPVPLVTPTPGLKVKRSATVIVQPSSTLSSSTHTSNASGSAKATSSASSSSACTQNDSYDNIAFPCIPPNTPNTQNGAASVPLNPEYFGSSSAVGKAKRDLMDQDLSSSATDEDATLSAPAEMAALIKALFMAPVSQTLAHGKITVLGAASAPSAPQQWCDVTSDVYVSIDSAHSSATSTSAVTGMLASAIHSLSSTQSSFVVQSSNDNAAISKQGVVYQHIQDASHITLARNAASASQESLLKGLYLLQDYLSHSAAAASSGVEAKIFQGAEQVGTLSIA